MNNNESVQSKLAGLAAAQKRILNGETFAVKKDLPVDPADVTETAGTDLQVGMHRIWNTGRTSTITAIMPVERSRTRIRVSYRSDTPRPDGQFNTVTQEYRKDSYFPIVSDAR